MFGIKRRKNLFYAVISLLFTLVLFFNANGSSLQGNIIPTPTNYEETLKDIAIQPQYDSTKYFIQGFTPSVTVKLKSDNRVQLNTELNAETRNFKVVANLTDLGPGTHEVALEVENLSSGVTATLETKTITVTIEKKVTKTFDVQTDLSQANLQDGYELGKIGIEPSQVEVTTGESTLKELDKVMASASTIKNATKDIAASLTVVAVDANGQTLPAVISPEQVKVTAAVTLPTKEVPIEVVPTGSKAANVTTINYELTKYNAVVSGPKTLLDQLESVSVSVDIANITKQTDISAAIEVPEGVTASPDKVTVTVKPVLQGTKSSTTTTSVPNSSAVTTPATTTTSTTETTTETTTTPATSETEN